MVFVHFTRYEIIKKVKIEIIFHLSKITTVNILMYFLPIFFFFFDKHWIEF